MGLVADDWCLAFPDYFYLDILLSCLTFGVGEIRKEEERCLNTYLGILTRERKAAL